VRKDGYPGSAVVADDSGGYQAGGECWLFLDGLRFDVAQDLARALTGAGLESAVETAWAPVPSVTASGKVACSPVAAMARGRSTDEDFVPGHATLDRPLDTVLLRKVLRAEGWQVLGPNESGDPTGRAWTEFGDLDHYGHEHGLRLAGQEYGHGGLSLQESVIPVLTVTRPKGIADAPAVEIAEARWTRLICRVTIEGAEAGYAVDLRRKANDPATSKAGGGKPLKNGKASLTVADDELQGEAISLVVLDDQGRAIAKATTVIGGDD
jgi:hypothetical protein